MAEWTPVFHVHSSLNSDNALAGGEIHESGQIIGMPNTFQPNVTVSINPTGVEKIFYMPWSDRPETLSDFLEHCRDVFRIHVSICANIITKYIIYVNEEELQRQMHTHGTIKGELYALNVFKRYAFESNLPFDSTRAGKMPLCDSINLNQEWSTKQILSQEQIESVQWMMSVEDAIQRGKGILMYERCIPIGSSWAYDIVHEHFFKQRKNGYIKARYKGAVLTNRAGSGKTACVVALTCESSIILPSSLEQQAHDMLFCPATLVLVPQNLVQQWIDDIVKFTNKKVVSLTSKEAKNITANDLSDYDFVIATTNFMKCKSYVDSLEAIMKSALGVSDKKMIRTTAAQKVCARKFAKQESDKFPLIELIHWNRLIIDEVHELFLSSSHEKERFKLVKSLQATFHWGLTGTPNLSRTEEVQNYYHFLSPKVCEDAEQHHHHPCLQHAVGKMLLRSFTHTHTTPKHILHKVKPSAYEYYLLQSFQTTPIEEIICLATYFVRENDNSSWIGSKTIDEICDVVQEQRLEFVSQLDEKIEQEQDPAEKEKLLEQKANLKKEYEFFSSNIKNIKFHSTCSICMEHATDSITNCGHCYCFSCICKIVVSRKCSFCRCEIKPDQTFQIAANNDIQIYGSKLCEASKLLGQILSENHNVLVFCQWKQIAIAFRELVQQKFRFPINILEGQSSRRMSILKNFRENQVGQALVLILERFASGLNLPEASRVIFLHAICEKFVGLEEQAIARSLRNGQTNEVEVHHFVINDSVEEALWKKTHNEFKTTPL